MTTERAINQTSQTARTATHDAPRSFLFVITSKPTHYHSKTYSLSPQNLFVIIQNLLVMTENLNVGLYIYWTGLRPISYLFGQVR